MDLGGQDGTRKEVQREKVLHVVYPPSSICFMSGSPTSNLRHLDVLFEVSEPPYARRR